MLLGATRLGTSRIVKIAIAEEGNAEQKQNRYKRKSKNGRYFALKCFLFKYFHSLRLLSCQRCNPNSSGEMFLNIITIKGEPE